MKNDMSMGSPSNQPKRSIRARTGAITGSVSEKRKFSTGFSSSRGSQLRIALPSIRSWSAIRRTLTVVVSTYAI